MTEVAQHPPARRSRRRLVVALIVAVVIGVVGIVVLRNRQPVEEHLVGEPAGPPSPAWRTDYFRNVQVRVPASWGYALDIESTWCAAGDPLPPEYQHPYVAINNPGAGAAVDCNSTVPAHLIQEHLTFVAGPFGGPQPAAAIKKDGFWVLTRQVAEVELTVWTRERALGDEIVASLTDKPQPIRTGCAAHSALEKATGTEPGHPFDLATIGSVKAVAICQYDIGSRGGLRARALLADDDAAHLVAELRDGPEVTTTCRDPALRRENVAGLVLVLRLDTGSTVYDLHVITRHCSRDGEPDTRFSSDGQTARGFSLGTCARLLVPPVAGEFALAYTGQSCS